MTVLFPVTDNVDREAEMAVLSPAANSVARKS